MLEKLDLTLKLSKQEYREISDPLGMRMFDLQHRCRAAGKGMILDHLIRHLDPRGHQSSINRKTLQDRSGGSAVSLVGLDTNTTSEVSQTKKCTHASKSWRSSLQRFIGL